MATTFRLKILMLHGGEKCYTNLQYQDMTEDYAEGNCFTVMTTWATQFMGDLRAMISQDATIYRLDGSLFESGGGIWTYGSEVVNLPGLYPDAGLPPFVTASWIKVADPVGQVGSDIPLIKHGRMQFSGVPEAFQDNGIATPAALALYEQFGNNIKEFDHGATNFFEMRLFRFAPGDTTGAIKNARVASVNFRRIGTQNTRKF